MVDFMTREDNEREAIEYGFRGNTVNLFLALKAPERHKSRVLAAREAAKAAVIAAVAPRQLDEEEIEILSAFLAKADQLGIGGILDIEGGATERVPAFQQLGTGRRNALDGEAWNAAIRQAFQGLPRIRAEVLGANSTFVLFVSVDLHYAGREVAINAQELKKLLGDRYYVACLRRIALDDFISPELRFTGCVRKDALAAAYQLEIESGITDAAEGILDTIYGIYEAEAEEAKTKAKAEQPAEAPASELVIE